MKKIGRYKKDLFVIGLFLLLGIGMLFFVYGKKTKCPMVLVRVDGVVKSEYALSQEGIYVIQGKGGTNTICIKDGKVWMKEADCPDHICVRTGKIQHVGQSIVCLPHKVVVEIVEKGNLSSEWRRCAPVCFFYFCMLVS